MLTYEPAVRFSSSFCPRYRQDSTKTLSQVWYGLVWDGWVKMPEMLTSEPMMRETICIGAII